MTSKRVTTMREEIRKKLTSDLYRSINTKMAERIAVFMQKKMGVVLPTWIIQLIITLALLVICLSTSFALHIFPTLPILVLFLTSIVYVFIVQRTMEYIILRVKQLIINSMLDVLEQDDDFQRLETILSNFFSHKNQFYFGIGFAIFTNVIFSSFGGNLIDLLSWPVFIDNLIFNFIHGVVVYYFINYVFSFLRNLNRFQFNLFEPNPSASVIIHQLDSVLNIVFYFLIIFGTIFTAWMRFADQYGLPKVSIMLSLILLWGLGIGMFIIHKISISNIIVSGKWRSLKNIQAQITLLQEQNKIMDQQTLDQINKLLDYHDRIRATPNSLINIRSLFDLANTFVIPGLGLLIGNFGDFLTMLRGLKLIP